MPSALPLAAEFPAAESLAAASTAGESAAESPAAVLLPVVPAEPPSDIEHTSPERSRPGLDLTTLAQLRAMASKHFPETGTSGPSADELIGAAAARLEAAPPAEAADVEVGLRAALSLAEMRLDPATLAATLIAAVPSAVGAGDSAEALGAEVAGLVEGAHRLGRVRWDRLEDERVETLRKMFLAMARDIRVVLIVLALRRERMLRLDRATPEEAQRLARETLAVHAPLANRLGIWQFKWQLEDASFRLLSPDAYAELTRALAETHDRREAFIAQAVESLREKLVAEQVPAEVSGRSKHVYSIQKKMQRKRVSFDEVHDISAVRVITERVQDCYGVLGIVHSMWTPLPHEFDDYIAMPKGNGYQSLHTAVLGPQGRVVEVQIRTREMHRLAELGVAAHWAYKEGRKLQASPRRDPFMLLRQLLDWERDVVDPHQLVDSLKTDIFEDQVFVFTPRGDVIDLALGSTPVDFAYRIHTEVGHRCKGARVNGQLVPLDYKLRTGDRVEILTHKQARPSRDWLNPALGYLQTAAALSKVRHWFREQGRPEAIVAGRELVSKELGRLDVSVSIEQIAEELGHPDVEDLFAAVGYGDRRPATITSAALSIEGREKGSELPVIPPPVVRPVAPPRGISLDQVDDIQGQRARCCNPVPGDDVVGFVTRGRGLMIHRRSCLQIKHIQEPERLVEVHWGSLEDEKHNVDIEVTITDRNGVLGDLLKLVANQGAYIASVEAHSTRRGDSKLHLSLDCRNAAHVAQVLERLGHHPEVLSLRRVTH